MNKSFFATQILIFLLLAACSNAENSEFGMDEPTLRYSPEAKTWRSGIMVEAFNSEVDCIQTARVSSWMETRPANGELYFLEGFPAMPDSVFKSLNPQELLHYCFANQEDAMQLCSDLLPEKEAQDRIYLHLPFRQVGLTFSERQNQAMKKDIGEIERIVNNCIKGKPDISFSMLELISRHHLYTSIPVLVTMYFNQEAPRNTLILSCLVELMEDAEYLPWQNSMLRQSAGDKYGTYLPITHANANLILFYATTFGQYISQP